MRRLLTATLLILLICILAVSAQAYTNDKFGFSINPPDGWIIDDTTRKDAVFFYGPVDEGLSVNFNIQVGSLLNDETLEQWVSAGKESLRNSSPNLIFISEHPRTINNISAYELVFNNTDQGSTLMYMQLCLLNNSRWAIITYTALPTTYEKYLATFQSSAETFNFLELASENFLGLDPELWAIIILVIVGIAFTVIFILLGRRHRMTRSSSTSSH